MGRIGNHPNIVAILHLGEGDDGTPYMVTELMGGGDVEDLLDLAQDNRLPLERTIEISKSVCSGLEFAHSQGIVHRHLKPGDEESLTREIIDLASHFGRYGYRRITALLRDHGWRVNHKRVERIWRREGLKVPKKQPKRRRLWLNDGSCIRLRPEHKNHVWAYDFVATRTHDGRPVRMLAVIDEYTRECLAIRAARSFKSNQVLELLAELCVLRGVPEHIRSDNGPEFTASAVREWLKNVGARTLYIEPGSPWENGYAESFNGKFRDELLIREIFYTLKEVQILIEIWRREYDTIRPHSSLGYRPPAPETFMPAVTGVAGLT